MKLNIPDSEDYDDARNQVRVAVFVRMDATWILAPAAGCHGDTLEAVPCVWMGGFVAGHPAPMFDVPITGSIYDMRGTLVRVEIEVLRAMKVGVSVTSRVPVP